MMKKLYQPGSYPLQQILITLLAAFLVTACASTPPPTAQMAISNEAINNANSAGSNEFAPVQLKSAIEKMEAAKAAMQNKKYDVASQLAEQAQADAQLAMAVTRSAKAQKAADALKEDSRILRQEIDRKTK
jgi:hypothetical protein